MQLKTKHTYEVGKRLGFNFQEQCRHSIDKKRFGGFANVSSERPLFFLKDEQDDVLGAKMHQKEFFEVIRQPNRFFIDLVFRSSRQLFVEKLPSGFRKNLPVHRYQEQQWENAVWEKSQPLFKLVTEWRIVLSIRTFFTIPNPVRAVPLLTSRKPSTPVFERQSQTERVSDQSS